MDPNKDFIHIDDVFKNLRNGEESEGSGAWLNMKGLLDAEMPVGGVVSGGRSVRRYIIPVIALLLLGGGGATYWQMKNNEPTIATSATTRPGSTTGNGTRSSGSGNDHGNGTASVATLPAADSGDKNNANATTPAATRALTANMPTPHNNNRSGRKQTGTNSILNPKTANHTTQTNTGAAIANNTPAAGKNKSETTQAAQKAANGNAANNTNKTTVTAGNNNTADVTGNKIVKHQQVVETIKPKEEAPLVLASASNKGPLPKHQATGNTSPNWKTAAVINNNKIVQSPDGNFYKEERDTFKRIDLVERFVYANGNTSRNAIPKMVTDTLAVTRIENIRYVPITRMDLAELQKLNVNITIKELVPLAKLRASTVSREHVSLVPLSNYKVASRRVDPSSFNKLIQNTAGGLAGYFDGSRNFYAAVMVGGNASFGNPGAFGMQLGIAGLLSLSERWTLVAELKYMNHYFSNYSLEDQSVSYDVSKTQTPSGWLFSGNELVTSTAYKVNSYGSIQMPIMLSYNLGRVSIFGGLNLAYSFPVDWEKRTNTNTRYVESQQQLDKNPYQNKSFLFDEKNDFASRFGLGYALGMNYDLSRKVSLDARMTQLLMDNAKGNTEAINKLFRMPSLQFSLGYYFGRKDKVVYIMDKR
jgi:hypothetical protein